MIQYKSNMMLKFSNRFLLLVVATVVTYSCSQPEMSGEAELPNVVIINVDDLGYGDVGAYGATMVQTPNMDRLAKEGRRFTDFHSASAVCSPSRYALITGTYPARVGLYGAMFLKSPLIVDTAKVTIAKVMKAAGYATAAIGKWHLGFGSDRPVNWNKPLRPGPLELGFDYYFGVPVLNSHPPFVYVENDSVVGYNPDDPFVYDTLSETRWFHEKFGRAQIGGAREAHFIYDDRKVGTTLKDKAVEYIEAKRDEPFFLYLATTNIHHPFTPSPEFIGTSKAGRYGDFIHELDWMIGEVLSALDSQGLTENTIVMLTSDNGGMLNIGGQEAYRAGHHMNGKLLGFKFDAWEGGHRVPFIVRWPGKIPAGSISDELGSNIDLLATLGAIVGEDSIAEQAVDSENLLAAFVGKPDRPVRDHLIIAPNSSKHVSVRKGPWMYIPARGGGGFITPSVGAHTFGGPAAIEFSGRANSDIAQGKIREDAPSAQLYNLEQDPYQQENLYDQYPQIVADMQELIDEKNFKK